MFNIIQDKDNWDLAIKKFSNYDIYHTYSYHNISKNNGEDSLVLLYAEDVLAWPLFAKKIPKTAYYDLSSAYGYPSPLFKEDNTNQKKIIEESLEFFSKKNFISIFSRLHPIISQDLIDIECNFIQKKGEIVYVDLTHSLGTIFKNFRKNHQRDIKRLLRDNYKITITRSHEYIPKFIEIYNQSMKRLTAKTFYFFDVEYYQNLFKWSEQSPFFIFVSKDEEIISGALFLLHSNYLHYHLGATNADYTKISPLKLIFYEAIKIGIEKEIKYLILGGGLGSVNDALFNFKLGFSPNVATNGFVKAVLNDMIYNELVAKNQSKISLINNSFFPLYRE